jgi:hypothetical protein
MGGVSNINKGKWIHQLYNKSKLLICLAKGHSREKMRRMAKSIKKSNSRIQPSVTTTRVMTKKKQKQLEKAIRHVKWT